MKFETIKKSLTLVLLFVAIILHPGYASGCTTPVFRYALEMWPAFKFRVEVVSEGNLNNGQIMALQKLKNASSNKMASNILVTESNDFNKYNTTDSTTPLIFLLPPTEQGLNDVIWRGELNMDNVQKIVDSPARQTIVENIRSGDAVSWILIEGMDSEKNVNAINTLQKELKLLSQNLKLASDATDIDGNPLDIKLINKGVNFSMFSISRDDPAEEVFIQMLLHTEADLPFVKAPIAFPVFGRGRVLYALVGNGIKSKLIEATCNSVIGWCSCTIKEDNPGADLLFTADWKTVAGDSTWIKAVDLPEITGMSGFLEEEEEKKETKIKPIPTKKDLTQEELSADIKENATQKSARQTDEIINPAKPMIVQDESIPGENTDERKPTANPLARNIFIVVISLLIVLPSISIYLRKRRS